MADARLSRAGVEVLTVLNPVADARLSRAGVEVLTVLNYPPPLLIALLSSSTTHVGHTLVKSELEALGHTVTSVAVANLGTTDLSTYDVLTIHRTVSADLAAVATAARAFIETARPVLWGPDVIQSATDGSLYRAGYAAESYYDSSFVGMEVFDADHPVTAGFTVGATVTLHSANIVGMIGYEASGTALSKTLMRHSNGRRLAGPGLTTTAVATHQPAHSLIVWEAGEHAGTEGELLPARMAFWGNFYVGAAGTTVTADFRTVLSRLLTWLTGTPPAPSTDRRLSALKYGYAVATTMTVPGFSRAEPGGVALLWVGFYQVPTATPSGWTLVGIFSNVTLAGNGGSFAVYARLVDGPVPDASLAFDTTHAKLAMIWLHRAVGMPVAISGNPADGVNAPGGVTSQDTAPVTVSAEGAVALLLDARSTEFVVDDSVFEVVAVHKRSAYCFHLAQLLDPVVGVLGPHTITYVTTAYSPRTLQMVLPSDVVPPPADPEPDDPIPAEDPVQPGDPGTPATGADVTFLDVDMPVGAAVGSGLLAQIVCHGTATVTPPTGWTLIRSDAVTDGVVQRVYERDSLLGATEPADYRWSFSAPVDPAGAIIPFDGVRAPSSVDVHAGATATGLSITAPGVTTTVDGTVLMHFFAAWDGVAEVQLSTSTQDSYNVKSGASAAATPRPGGVKGAKGGKTKTASATTTLAAATVAVAPEVAGSFWRLDDGSKAPLYLADGARATVRLSDGARLA